MVDEGLPIDPRFEARLVAVRQVRRARCRRRIGRPLVVAVLATASGWALETSPLLAVRQVVVKGAAHTGRAATLSITTLDRHHQMLDLNPDVLRARLRALPWIQGVSVRRQWPTTVKVTVTEREPVAQLSGADGQPVIVDGGGRVLAVGREASGLLRATRPSLPVLKGAAPPAPAAGQLLGVSARGALALASAVPPSLADAGPTGGIEGRGPLTMTAVVVEPDGTLTASLSPEVEVIFGSADQLSAKLAAMRAVLSRAKPSGPLTVDLRVTDSPVLTEGSPRSIVSTIQRG